MGRPAAPRRRILHPIGLDKAPSAMNLLPWAFVVVQDRKLLKEFSDRSKDLIAKADKTAKLKERLTDPEFNIFYNAGTLIVICAKPARQHPDWDCCLAAQNLMLVTCGGDGDVPNRSCLACTSRREKCLANSPAPFATSSPPLFSR